MTFRRFLICGFRQKLWRKNYFFAVLARSALRRVRVQSDLLDGTAFQASTLVACTEGPSHKEKYTYFALCFYFLGKLTRPRLVHCAHAAILRQTSPDHTHCRRVVYYHIIMCMLWLFATVYTLLLLMSLLCHTRTPRLMHFCAFILLELTVSSKHTLSQQLCKY